MTYLRRFPLNALKIDRSFVSGLPDDHDQAIVEAIVAMARSFSLDVVAEGVETAAQARLVRRLGCASAQGFYYYRPMSASAVAEVLAGGAEVRRQG